MTAAPIIACVALLALLVACSNAAPPPPAGAASAGNASAAPAAAYSGPTLVAGRAARGAVIVLEPAAPGEYPPPAGPAVLDQYAKQFLPPVLLARVGQPVEFRNSEDTPHNVDVVRRPAGTAIFHVSTDPFGKYVHTFDRAGEYHVTCDIHEGMQATVIVTATPYVALADDTGSFSIPDVPAGTYTLKISGSTSVERRIEVSGARMTVS